MAQPLYTGITTAYILLNYRIKEMVQKRISIVHEDREVEVFHRLLDGKAKYDNK